MGFEKHHLFGKVEVDVTATAPGTLTFKTETPGQALSQRFSFTIPATTRCVIRSRLPGNMIGHYVKATYTPTSQAELYGVRVWCRELPDGQWGWHPLPVMDTPVEFIKLTILDDPTQGGASAEVGFSELKLPVEPTPDMHRELQIPVEPTPVEFVEMKLPVEATSESFTSAPVPVEPTPVEFTSLSIPVAQTPDQYAEVKMPVEGTPDSYSEYKMPVKPTPPVPSWIEVGVDE